LSLATLTGCSLFDEARPAIAVTLPPMPQSVAAPCRDPGVKAGEPVLSEFAASRLALAECRRKHANAVAFYNKARSIR
jgi:hypothetical protein